MANRSEVIVIFLRPQWLPKVVANGVNARGKSPKQTRCIFIFICRVEDDRHPPRIALPSGSEVFRSKIKFGDSFDCVCRLYSSLTGTKNDQISKRSSTRNGFCFVCPTGSKSKQQAAWSTYRCYLSLQLRTKAAAAAISWMAILQTMAQPRHWLG